MKWGFPNHLFQGLNMYLEVDDMTLKHTHWLARELKT